MSSFLERVLAGAERRGTALVRRQARMNERMDIPESYTKAAAIGYSVIFGVSAYVGMKAFTATVGLLAANLFGAALVAAAVTALAVVVIHDLVKISIKAQENYNRDGHISLSGRFMFNHLWIGKGLDKVLTHFGQ